MKYFFFVILTFFTFNTFGSDRFNFANDLLSQGDLFRALTVFKEVEFKFRGTIKGYSAQKKILQIHLESKDYEGFDFQVDQIFKNYSSYLKKINRKEIQAETFFIIGNHSKAFMELAPLQVDVDKKYLFRAYAESNETLPSCFSLTCESIKKIEQNIISAKKEKNEYIALGLGIIPGMGQIYAGNTWSGIASFVLNSFFITTSIIAFNNKEPAMGLTSTLVGSTFYLSSIYAGYETARRYNVSRSITEKHKLSSIPIQLNLMNIIFE